MNTNSPILYIVIPCYNEEEVLPKTAPQFLEELEYLISQDNVSPESRILFVDDGSKDATWKTIEALAAKDTHFIGARLSGNRGHQNAVYAGLMEARDNADVAVSIDCDGQDDITAIRRMIDEYENGSEIVFGVRNDRETDSAAKRKTAETYYSLMNVLGTKTIYNHADYRLMGHRALDALAEYNEVNLFLRGIVPQLGFKTSTVEYARANRVAGSSEYTLSKMLKLAFDGITSFSTKPIHLVNILGIIISIIGLIGVIWAIVMNFIGNTISGWTSLICIVLILGGLQMLSIGIIGEYIGKIYLETKARPRYIISERTEINSD